MLEVHLKTGQELRGATHKALGNLRRSSYVDIMPTKPVEHLVDEVAFSINFESNFL